MSNDTLKKCASYAKTTKEKLACWRQRFFESVQGPYKATAASIEELENKLDHTDDTNSRQGLLQDHWSFWLIGLVAVFIGYIVFQSLELLYLIITAFILAMAIESIIAFFERIRGISRGFAIGLSYFLLIIFLLSAVILVIPFIIAQMIDLISSMLDQVIAWQEIVQNKGLEAVLMDTGLPSQIKEWLSSMLFTDGESVGQAVQTAIISNIDQLVSVGTTSIKDAGSVVVNIITGFFSVAVQMTIVLVMSIFFSIEKKRVIHLLAQVSGHVERTELVLMKVYRKLGLWLKGQALLCVSIFVLVLFGLWVISLFGIDLPNKFTLALIAGMVEFIPYLGPFLGMFPALLIGISLYGLKGLVTVLILYWVIQQSENNILVPMVMSHTLGSSPLLIFICMILGGSLFGFLGILLAVPISVIVSILYDTYSKT